MSSFFVRHVDGCLRISRKLLWLQFHDTDPGDVHSITQQVHIVHGYKILQNRQSARLFTHITSFSKAFTIPAFEIKLFLLLALILSDVTEKVAVTFWPFFWIWEEKYLSRLAWGMCGFISVFCEQCQRQWHFLGVCVSSSLPVLLSHFEQRVMPLQYIYMNLSFHESWNHSLLCSKDHGQTHDTVPPHQTRLTALTTCRALSWKYVEDAYQARS